MGLHAAGGGHQGPVGVDLVREGLGGSLVDSAAGDQAGEQGGVRALHVGCQGLVGQGCQVIPEEGAVKKQGGIEAAGLGQVRGLGILEIGAVLIPQGPQQEHHVILQGAGPAGAEGCGAGAVGDAVGIQPGHVGRGVGADVGEGVRDLPGVVGGLGLVLRAVEPHQHDGGLTAGGGAVQVKAVAGAPEHADGGQVLSHAVVLRGGSADAQGCRQQQGGEQQSEKAFHRGNSFLLFGYLNPS